MRRRARRGAERGVIGIEALDDLALGDEGEPAEQLAQRVVEAGAVRLAARDLHLDDAPRGRCTGLPSAQIRPARSRGTRPSDSPRPRRCPDPAEAARWWRSPGAPRTTPQTRDRRDLRVVLDGGLRAGPRSAGCEVGLRPGIRVGALQRAVHEIEDADGRSSPSSSAAKSRRTTRSARHGTPRHAAQRSAAQRSAAQRSGRASSRTSSSSDSSSRESLSWRSSGWRSTTVTGPPRALRRGRVATRWSCGATPARGGDGCARC